MADVQREIKIKQATGLFLHGERVYLHRPAIKPAGDKDMAPMLFVRWCAICSRFHTLYVSMQRRLWPIAQLGAPLSKLVLSKLVKFLIPAALVNHGCCWKYTDQRHNSATDI